MQARARRQTHARRKPKATTEQVVGRKPDKPAEVPPRWRKHYARLVDLRERYLCRQADLTRDALEEQPTYSMHLADAGTDAYDRDLALGMLSSEQDAVYAIEQAIDRIHNGTYGICELTGKPIEADRLAAIPWTQFSAAAEKQMEKEGATKHARLGPRRTVLETAASSEPEEPEEPGEPPKTAD